MRRTRSRGSRALCGIVGTLCFLIASPPPSFAEDSSEIRQKVFAKLGSGARHLRKGDAVRAVEDLCWTAERLLNSHDAAWMCGQALLAAREPDRAVEFLQLATDLDPKHLPTWVTLGEAFLSAGNVEESRGSFFRALEIRSDHSPAYDGLARLAQQTGKPERALELFGQALEANPADARARLHRGQMHLEAGRVPLALEDIREAARLRPDDGKVQLGLADVLMRSGLLGDALAAGHRAAEIQPGNAMPHALIAQVLARIGELGEAEKAARLALERDPALARGIIALGDIMGRLGRLDEAIGSLDIQPSPRISVAELEEIYARRDHWIERRDELGRLSALVESAEASADEQLTLAEALMQTGDAARAMELSEAVVAATDETDLLRRASYLLGSAGRTLESERALEKIVNRPEATANDWLNLGVARELSGDPTGATDAYRSGLDKPQPPASIHLGLARLALIDNDKAGAIAHLKNYQAAAETADSDESIRVTQALERLEADLGRGAGDSP